MSRSFVIVLVALAAAGCRAPGRGAEEIAGPSESARPFPAEARARAQASGAPTSVEGRPLEHVVLGTGEDVVLLVAAIHGDETAGTRVLRLFEEHLRAHPELLLGRRVVIVAEANPDGVARGSRGNANGVDLNRNFPAPGFRPSSGHGLAPLSEPESAFLHGLVLAHRPDRVLSFHQAANLVDWDGPGEELARAVAEHAALRVARMGSRPGSLGSWVGEHLGIPILTVEQPASASQLGDEPTWERYGALLLAALQGVD